MEGSSGKQRTKGGLLVQQRKMEGSGVHQSTNTSILIKWVGTEEVLSILEGDWRALGCTERTWRNPEWTEEHTKEHEVQQRQTEGL